MKLSEKAMLVDLNISQWNARRADEKATAEVIQANGAKANSGKFNKLLVDLASVKRYQRAANDARTFHYSNTLPWDDEGSRILPSENYLPYTKKIRQLQAAFYAAVDEFVREYPALIQQAKRDLGRLFNPGDYPAPAVVKSKFHFSTRVNPMPDAADFRVSLAGDEVKIIQDEIEQRVKDQVNAAVNDLWARLQGALSHLVEKLRNSEAIFRDSLIGNISELTDVLPRLNLTGDQNLGRIINEARAALANLNPDTLRKDEKERKAAADKAEAILKKMAGYTGA